MITTNATVNIQRFVETAWEKNYSTVHSGVSVYIEPIDEELSVTFEGQAAYETFRLMSYNTDILEGDGIVEGAINYKVKGSRVFNSIVWTHVEAIIQKEYD